MARSTDLPDFTNPPLNEVVVGIQFDPPQGYQQIMAGEVWALFRDKYPIVQEWPPLQPAFETFGLPLGAQMNFGVLTSFPHPRFWFLSNEGTQLVQFQNDRLLQNWRQIGDENNEYPRFERLISEYRENLLLLENYFSRLQMQKISVRQCEVLYINRIRSLEHAALDPSDWLSFVDFSRHDADDFACNFRSTIRSATGQPQGRLICESSSAVDGSMRPLISLTLTARGAPDRSDIESALDFIELGHNLIVKSFAQITTESAHKVWGRTQ